MIHHQEHIEHAQEINKAFGGTVYGNIILFFASILLAGISNINIELKDASTTAEFIINWAIKILALLGAYYTLKNARAISKRNQELKNKETDVQ